MSKQLKPHGKKYARFIRFFDHLPDGEPCLCLGSSTTRDRIKGFIMPNSVKSRRSAVVIPLKQAYLYGDGKSGEPTEYALVKSFEIATLLGLDVEKSTLHSIVDAIIGGLPDLISMMPLDTSLSKKQFEEKAARHGVVVSIGDRKIFDAS